MANTIGLQAIIDVSQFNQGLRLYIKGMLDMTQATTQASTQINRLGVAASAGLGAALGQVAVQSVQALVSGLGTLARSIGENISSFQSLAISLNFFAARALQADTDMPLKEALAATTVEAQGLMLWVERLATLSPFTAEQVGNAFRTAQAYGLSLAAAQKLVPLLVDFAAVNSLSPEVLQRVALAMAQIQARGKLASQEINQLANAGLPIRDLLVKSLQVTRGELEKMLEDGLIPASAAIQAVTGYLEGFEGAAERVTRGTLHGIVSSLQDIRDISSRDLFGPMVSAFFPILNQLIDIGNSTEFKAGIKIIGNELGEGLAQRIKLGISQLIILTQTIAKIPTPVLQATAIFLGFSAVLVGLTATAGLLAVAINILINPFTVIIAILAGFVTAYSTNFKSLRDITTSTANTISSVFSAIGRTISTVTTSVISVVSSATSSIGEFANVVVGYGAAVVQSFSAGIMGAMDFLVDSMQFIGQVLAFWLQPGSPPRVAPDLDKWGTESANVWLSGWRGADFDILSGISTDIGNALSALVNAGKLDELSAPRILRALRTELAGAIDQFRKFGKVSEETLNRVARSAGPASNQVKELLKGYVNLTLATDAVKASQEKLNEISERYDGILTPIRQKLRDISELRQQADEQKEILSLQRTIANSGASFARKQAAQLRIQEIMLSREVRGIEKKQDTEETLAEKEQKAAEKRKTNAEEQLERTKALLGVQNDQLNLYGEELKILEKIRKEQERLAKEARQKMLEQLKRQLEIAQLLQGELKDAVGVFKAQYTLADATATAAEKTAAKLELQAILGRRIVRDFEAIELGIDPSQITAIRNTLITLEDIGIKGSPFDGLSDDIYGVQEDSTKLVKEMNDAMQEIRTMFKETREEIDTFLTSIDNMLPPFLKFRKRVDAADTSLSDTIRTTRAATEEFNEWPPLFRTLATAFAGIASGLVTSRLLTIIPKLLLGLTGPVGIVTALVSAFAAAWAGDWFNIRQVTSDVLTFVSKAISRFFEGDQWGKFAQDVSNNVQYALTAIEGFGNTVKDVFLFVIKPILEGGFSLENLRKSLQNFGGLVLVALKKLRGDITEDAKGVATSISQTIRDFLSAYWNPFLAALLLSSGTIINIFKTIFVEIGNTFKLLPGILSFAFKTAIILIKPILGLIKPLIVKALQGINGLILNALGGLGNLIAAAIALPFKALGKIVDLNAILSYLIEQFTTGFASKVLKAAPKIWEGLIVGLVKLDSLIGNTVVAIFSKALSTVQALGKGYISAFKFLDTLTFEGFRFFTEAGFKIQKFLPVLSGAFVTFGKVVTKVLLFVADSILSLVAIDYVPFYDFFNRIKPTATATMPILVELFDATRAGLTKLIEIFRPAYAAFKANILPIFLGAEGTSGGFLATITRIGKAIGGNFVNVFKTFKGVGPIIAGAFKGLGAGLRDVGTLGSIKVLEFFEGLSKGILSFAGKGQAKLGKALGGIFQGAFKGITGGVLKTPGLLFDIFKNINPGAIAKGIGSIFTSIKKISGAFGGLLNPLNLLISAIDFFGFAFTHNIDGVENRAVGFVDALKRTWADLISGKLWQDISEKAGKAFQFISAAWQEFQTNGIDSPKLQSMLATVKNGIITWATTTGSAIMTSIREFWLPIFGVWIRESIENLGTTLGQVLIFVRDFLVTTGQFLGGVISQAWSFFWTWWTDQGGAEKTSAWLNDIITLITEWIVTSATFLYDNFVGNWLPAFTNWLVDEGGASIILNALGAFLGVIAKWIVDQIPVLLDLMLGWATAFVSWLGPAMGWAIENLGKLLGEMVRWIIGTGVPMLVGGVIYLAKALIDWISGNGDSAAAGAPTKLGEFLQAILTFFTESILPALYKAGASILEGLWLGLTDLSAQISATKAGKAIEDFMGGVQLKILEVREAGLQMGKNFIDGITSAFTTYVAEPYQAVKDWLWGLVGAGQEATESHSPSELTKRLIGEPLAQGIEEGFQTLMDSDIFKAVRNLAVNGLSALREDGTDEVGEFSTGTLKIVDDLYAYVSTATNVLATGVTEIFTLLSQGVLLILNDFMLKSRLIWDTVRTDATTQVGNMQTNIITQLSNFALTLSTAMATLKGIIVGAFTLANTESVAEVQKLASAILSVLVGQGEADQTSITYQVKVAMDAAGRSVGRAFVAGLIFSFSDQDSLNPLWTTINLLVDQIVKKFEERLIIGSPSKLAANAIGKPITQGIGQGMMSQMRNIGDIASRSLGNMLGGNSGFMSQFNNRPGTFMPSNVTNISRNQEMNLYVTSQATSQGIISDFGVMRAMLR